MINLQLTEYTCQNTRKLSFRESEIKEMSNKTHKQNAKPTARSSLVTTAHTYVLMIVHNCYALYNHHSSDVYCREQQTSDLFTDTISAASAHW